MSLVPGWTAVAYTGADGTDVATLLASAGPGIGSAFRFTAGSQAWLAFNPAGPVFLNGFTTVDRLSGLLIFNETNATLTVTWDQVAAAP
ncbi:MAG TPA: hypothetical protein QGF05_14900 [Dehalococcoidia bacterium]|nr:hypothetical protein [Dehalococcoidia bacterium]